MTLKFSLAKQYETEGKLVLAAKHYQLVIDNYSSSLLKSLVPFSGLSKSTVDLEQQQSRDALHRILNSPNVSTKDLNAIGIIYAEAKGINKNDLEALRWLKKAGNRGNAVALKNIGVFYEMGRAVSKNIITAIKYYQQAVDKGCQEARIDLQRLCDSTDEISIDDLITIGVMYCIGKDVLCNYAEAHLWFQKAKQKDSAIAIRNIALLHECGYGVPKNIALAIKYYQRAKNKGNPIAKLDLKRINMDEKISPTDLNAIGMMYADTPDIRNDVKALTWLKKAREKGAAAAIRNIGMFYETGRVKSKNIVIAVERYQQAIEKGYAEARKDLQRLYTNADMLSADDLNAISMKYFYGKGIQRNYTEAFLWLQKAKAKGSVTAYRSLGVFYECGYGVAKDFVLAMAHYEQAKVKGYNQAQSDIDRLNNNESISPAAMNMLGLMFQHGREVKQDLLRAKFWYEKAMRRYYAPAYFNLAALYEQGNGVNKDLRKAAKLYQESAQRGYPVDQNKLQQLAPHLEIIGSDVKIEPRLIDKMNTWAEEKIERAPHWFKKQAIELDLKDKLEAVKLGIKNPLLILLKGTHIICSPPGLGILTKSNVEKMFYGPPIPTPISVIQTLAFGLFQLFGAVTNIIPVLEELIQAEMSETRKEEKLQKSPTEIYIDSDGRISQRVKIKPEQFFSPMLFNVSKCVIDEELLRKLEAIEKYAKTETEEKLKAKFLDFINWIQQNGAFNSSKIFRVGASILANLKTDGAAVINTAFPRNIAQIILGGIFSMACARWSDINLYVCSDHIGGLKSSKKDQGQQGRFTFKLSPDHEYFLITSEKWPAHPLYVCGDSIGGLITRSSSQLADEHYISILPQQNGRYFILSSKKWSDYTLYVCNDAIGGVKSYRGMDPGPAGHFIIRDSNEAELLSELQTEKDFFNKYNQLAMLRDGTLPGSILSTLQRRRQDQKYTTAASISQAAFLTAAAGSASTSAVAGTTTTEESVYMGSGGRAAAETEVRKLTSAIPAPKP